MGPATGTGLASGENREGSPCPWGQITLQASLAGGQKVATPPAALPTLWWLGTTPALGLDAREPGGAGGDPRSPGSPRPACRCCWNSQGKLVPGPRQAASAEEEEAAVPGWTSTGWPRCLTARSTPITASMTTPTTTLPAAPTRKNGLQGQRTGDPRASDRAHRSGRGLGHPHLTQTRGGGISSLRRRSLRKKGTFQCTLETASGGSTKI